MLRPVWVALVPHTAFSPYSLTFLDHTVVQGYKSLPATPSISKSTEDIRRKRSFTNYLQVPPSPGVFPLLVKRLSQLTPPVLEDEEPR